jgi:uncharacterized protein
MRKDKQITPIAQLILEEDLAALELELKAGWQILEPLQFSQVDLISAMTFACQHNSTKVIAWLIGKVTGPKTALLSDKRLPAIIAASNGEISTIELLLDNGADINSIDRLGRNVISMALYSKSINRIPWLVARGFNVKKDGRSLRQAVFGRQSKAVKVLLDFGFDPNFHVPDQVFPHNPSAVHVAASNQNDFETVQLLVKHGADITVKDSHQDRPFNAAMKNKDARLCAYLKELEPPEWHDEKMHLASLAQFNLPQSMVDLCGELDVSKRTISLSGTSDYGVRYIALTEILMLKVFSFDERVLIDFVGETDNYDTFLAWYPAEGCLAYFDDEHGEFKALGKWEDFLVDPPLFFERYLSEYF